MILSSEICRNGQNFSEKVKIAIIKIRNSEPDPGYLSSFNYFIEIVFSTKKRYFAIMKDLYLKVSPLLIFFIF